MSREGRENDAWFQTRGKVTLAKPKCAKEGCHLFGEVHPKCRAHNRQGEPCSGVPLVGQFVCYFHGGANDVGRERGLQRKAMMDAAQLVQFDPDFDESPEEGLLREVSWSAQIAAAYGLAIAEMEGPLASFSPGQGEKMRALIQAWTDERQLHARLCKLAIDAGIEQRRLDLAEKQAEMLVQVLTAVLGDPRLQLSEEQVIEAKIVAVDVMRSLPRGADVARG